MLGAAIPDDHREKQRATAARWRLLRHSRLVYVGCPALLLLSVAAVILVSVLTKGPQPGVIPERSAALAAAAAGWDSAVTLLAGSSGTAAAEEELLQHADAVYAGEPLKVEDLADSLELPSPFEGDPEKVVLTNAGNASVPQWTWPDLCDDVRTRAGTVDFTELRRRAVGPFEWNASVAALPRSNATCIGPRYLPFFRESMTFRHRPTLLYGSKDRMRWAVDTDFASYSNITVPADFRYMADPRGLCSGFERSETSTLFLTLSQLKDKEERELIRTFMPMPANMKRVFLMGRPVKSAHYMTRCDYSDCVLEHTWDEALEREAAEHGDIVWADFLDTYQNLTLKTTMGVHWAATRCPQAEFVFKLDVDMLVNFGQLQDYQLELLADTQRFDRFEWEGWCMTYTPLRSNSRNIVTWDEWPGSYYPNYASGPAYMYHRDAVPYLLAGLYRIAPQPIEDMHMGTVDTLMGFVCTHGNFVWSDADDTSVKDPCKVLIAARGTAPEMRLVDAWKACPANLAVAQQQQQQQLQLQQAPQAFLPVYRPGGEHPALPAPKTHPPSTLHSTTQQQQPQRRT